MRKLALLLVFVSGFGELVASGADFRGNLVILRNYMDHSEEQVVAALNELAALQDRRAIGPVSDLLTVRSATIRTAARQALIELRAMDQFARQLRSSVPQERQSTAQVLRFMGTPAIPLLLPLLGDPEPQVRGSALVSLGALAKGTKDQRALDGLVRALNDESPFVRESAIVYLGELGDRKIILPLIGFVRQNQLVYQAFGALNRLAHREEALASAIVGEVRQLLTGTDLTLVERGIKLLRFIEAPQAITPLLEMLEHESPRIRYAAIQGLLPYREDPRVLAAVERLSRDDEDALVRTTARSYVAGNLDLD